LRLTPRQRDERNNRKQHQQLPHDTSVRPTLGFR
jgi:hypothetical protein